MISQDNTQENFNKQHDISKEAKVNKSALDAGLVAWPKDRRKELSKLLDVILTVSNLNCGSDFLGKTEECIQEAILLNRGNINTGRESLTQFLIAKAAGN